LIRALLRPASLLLAILSLGGCAAEQTPPAAPPSASSGAVAPGFVQTGMASWYGAWHRGRATANGEPFDDRAFTAAHRSLPFGTVLRVTNLASGRVVTVRINDRGPYIQGRILDLSAAAAKALGITRGGVARVRIEQIASSKSPDDAIIASASRQRV